MDENSIRFLYGGKICDDPADVGGVVCIEGDADISTGGVCGVFLDKSAAPSGDDAASGTLETARSTALKLYFGPSEGLSRLADLVGVDLDPGEAAIGGGVSILLDDEVEEDDDFGGFIIIELNASCWSFRRDADGARYILLASSVAFASGSGISNLSDWKRADISGSLEAEKFGNIER